MEIGTKIKTFTLVLLNIFNPVFMIVLPMYYAKPSFIALGFAVLLYEKKYRRSFIFLIIIIALELVSLVISYNVLPLALAQWLTMFIILSNYLPAFMYASLLIFDTPNTHLISALEKFKLPKHLVVAITITLRYLPIFSREFVLIKEAMRLRGIDFTFKHPLKSFEFFIVPQLFRCSILAEELSSAGLTRGITAKCQRTNFNNQRLAFTDWLLLATTALVFLGGLYVKYCH